MKKIQLFVILFFILIIGCENKKVVDQDVMAKVYVDILISKQIHQDNLDSIKIARYNIFEKHQVTENSYTTTLDSYGENIELWDSLFIKAETYLDSLRKENLKN
ncbi:MAG: DUF4296 domain-containing protein [Melioribacteraceae bacterium]|nr:DUF4296 domain-containing protein [Melioribacteraceae bacterium]MCF8354232.1 DUF4296 domain-containing protein [Melioribacteraceae bacterium]MCF8394737.1 DUF4296 domain-containing protein [Melioribacteraceae bacterium]MCF8417963.1 DUF4296 domain-containing protein [Melioribacteraceae bacterium]